ncbi:carbohydrate ABC transporter membrane protein 2 (CUT1 family) [Dongia mobilis]|uniref:Maltose/maltodextrin transport system permease protein MalG n=1 Tax=Dongia mobilis TaxID=578943 RepID=A0A4R6WW22_9PROT|nr:carbohydrate ABC transporter permease [Dongia mobilis]TDQ83222.1 carbohydrate ABC transporter membrane protein 2 (CUT1 family) [Dongia mobilis]
MSIRNLNGRSRAWALIGCLFWFLFTLFPIYWVIITSFKTSLSVVGQARFIPFVDFEPSLLAWQELFGGVRGEFMNTFIASTIVSLSSAVLATAIGAMAAYALVRFPFRVKLAAGLVFFVVALGGYLLGANVFGWSRATAMFAAFGLALLLSLLVNRVRVPGPILGNDDIIFWFVSQRMFPPIVAAFALFLMYSEIGRLGFKMIDTYVGLTLAYIAFSLPIVIWLMRDFFAALPVEVEEAAMVDNVPSWRIFTGIVVPMSTPGLVATFMITLAFVWNEFLFALFLTNARWQTLPILVAGQNSQRGDEWWSISAAALIAIVPMMVMAAILSRLMRSGLLLGAIK